MKKLILIVAMIACLGTANALEPKMQKSALNVPPRIEFKDYGLYGLISYDFIKTLSIDGVFPAPTLHGATGVVGFQFRRQTGVGLGFSYWYDQNGLFSQLPLFVELRSNYLRTRVTPYSALQLGYSFALSSRMQQATDAWYIDRGGAMVGILAGIRIAVTHTFGLSLGIGYQLLHADRVMYSDQYSLPAKVESVTLHNLRVNFALNF